jgi:hypothetical protein
MRDVRPHGKIRWRRRRLLGHDLHDGRLIFLRNWLRIRLLRLGLHRCNLGLWFDRRDFRLRLSGRSCVRIWLVLGRIDRQWFVARYRRLFGA